MDSTFRVRTATVEDAEALARLHLECWLETYSEILSPDFFTRQSVEDRLALWLRILDGPHATRAYVAEVNGKLVGFAGSIPATESEHPTELWGIYLLKDFHGSGLGQQLLDATLGDDEAAALWVAAENPRAQAFYRRNGFEPTGEEEILEDWERIRQRRMIRKAKTPTIGTSQSPMPGRTP